MGVKWVEGRQSEGRISTRKGQGGRQRQLPIPYPLPSHRGQHVSLWFCAHSVAGIDLSPLGLKEEQCSLTPGYIRGHFGDTVPPSTWKV